MAKRKKQSLAPTECREYDIFLSSRTMWIAKLLEKMTGSENQEQVIRNALAVHAVLIRQSKKSTWGRFSGVMRKGRHSLGLLMLRTVTISGQIDKTKSKLKTLLVPPQNLIAFEGLRSNIDTDEPSFVVLSSIAVHYNLVTRFKENRTPFPEIDASDFASIEFFAKTSPTATKAR